MIYHLFGQKKLRGASQRARHHILATLSTVGAAEWALSQPSFERGGTRASDQEDIMTDFDVRGQILLLFVNFWACLVNSVLSKMVKEAFSIAAGRQRKYSS